MDTMNALPESALVDICKLLKNRHAVARTCEGLRDIWRSVVERIEIDMDKTPITHDDISTIATRYSSLQHIGFVHERGVDAIGAAPEYVVATLAKRLRHLASVSYRASSGTTYELPESAHAPKILKSISSANADFRARLVSLHIRDNIAQLKAAEMRTLSSLSALASLELFVRSIAVVDDDAVDDVNVDDGDDFRSLQSLTLEPDYVDVDGYTDGFPGSLTRLTRLEWRTAEVDFPIDRPETLSRLVNLQHLDIYPVPSSEEVDISFHLQRLLSTLTMLTTLHIDSTQDEEGVLDLPWTSLTNLRTLDVQPFILAVALLSMPRITSVTAKMLIWPEEQEQEHEHTVLLEDLMLHSPWGDDMDTSLRNMPFLPRLKSLKVFQAELDDDTVADLAATHGVMGNCMYQRSLAKVLAQQTHTLQHLDLHMQIPWLEQAEAVALLPKELTQCTYLSISIANPDMLQQLSACALPLLHTLVLKIHAPFQIDFNPRRDLAWMESSNLGRPHKLFVVGADEAVHDEIREMLLIKDVLVTLW
jgi:hypothetical protein